jgi:hypothetical protein
MNIFTVHFDPLECAKVLDDKRLVKMVLETAQLLSNALPEGPYKRTHISHPCSLWVAANQTNYDWTLRLLICYLAEYTMRFDKQHKCEQLVDQFIKAASPEYWVSNPASFVNCTPFKDSPVFEAYKLTLQDKWKADKRKPRWSRDETMPENVAALIY